MRGYALLASVASFTSIGCIPYTVGTTARPLPRDSTVRSMAFTVMPRTGTPEGGGNGWISVDGESRRGIDSVSDLGIRLVSGAGIVVNYKRLLTKPRAATNVAIMPGAGFLHLGQHAHLELTFLASRDGTTDSTTRRGERRLTPYGGIRLMQTAPLNSDALHDEAVAGAFVGVRIGSERMGVSPEIGVFYDRSAMKARTNTIVIVPALVVHGNELIEMLRGPRPRRDRPRWR
jgi:hypothetical protein